MSALHWPPALPGGSVSSLPCSLGTLEEPSAKPVTPRPLVVAQISSLEEVLWPECLLPPLKSAVIEMKRDLAGVRGSLGCLHIRAGARAAGGDSGRGVPAAPWRPGPAGPHPWASGAGSPFREPAARDASGKRKSWLAMAHRDRRPQRSV